LTEKPFVQAITDVLSRQTVFYDGRVVFVGDAVAGFRPHTAASTSQAAFHALKLNDYLRREKVDWKAFEREVRQFAVNGVRHGIQLGNRIQFDVKIYNRIVMDNQSAVLSPQVTELTILGRH